MRKILTTVTAALAALVVGLHYTPRLATALETTTATVSGTAFVDVNANGRLDDGEKGLPNVMVSDGVKIVRTGADGKYKVDVDVDRRLTDIVFISKPAGYTLPNDDAMTPRFYRTFGQLTAGASATADFALVEDPKSLNSSFTFANVADPHVNVDMQRQFAEINATAQDLAFVQVSGDLTNNATDAEFRFYRQATAQSKVPVWPAVGNHEYSGGANYAARIDNYRRYVGPEWYSFDYGNRHFIVLENIGGAPFAEQRAWAEQDLAENAKGKRVVVLMHQPMNVPFGSPSEYDTYAELLRQYKTELILVGHEHSNDVDEEWVKGAKHIQTNSSSYTIDHSPRGFRYVHMSPKSFDNPFRMYGVDRELAITSPAPKATIAADRFNEVQISAYHTSDDVAKARYRFDGGGWKSLNPSGDFTWFAKLNRAPSEGAHTIDVEVEAASGLRWTRSESFRVTDAEPTPIVAGADWAQYHGDQQHSGVASTELDPADLGLSWTFRTKGVMLTGSPVVADGVAYAGTRDENGLEESKVHAVDIATGRELWDFTADSSVHGTPAVADGIVYVPSLHATLYALDADSGRLLWKREAERPDPPLNRRAYSYYSPTVADGKVFWPYQTRHGKASSGLLAALNPRTGAQIWEAPMTGATMSDGTAAVADGIVYVGNETADRIVAYDENTGARLWTSTARLGGWQDASPVVAGGKLLIGSNNGVVARDAKTGADLWTYTSTDTSWIPQNATASAPAIAGDRAYMGFPDGRVTALNVATGAVAWSVRLPGKPYFGGVLSAPAISGEHLYIGNNDGKLYALRLSDGALEWSYEIGTWVASSPAISGNTLLVGAWDGNLYAFSEQHAKKPALGTRELGEDKDTLETRGAAYRAQATKTGPVSSISVYLEKSQARNVAAGIYADENGKPGALLGQATVSITGKGWQNVGLPSPVALTKGTAYWIAVLGADGKLVVRDHAGDSSPSETLADGRLTSLPARWITGHRYQDGPLSAFAE